MTAAHCFYNNEQIESATLALATVNTDEPYYTMQISEDDKIYLHPEYNKLMPFENNVAVIVLKKKLLFHTNIGKINMIDRNYIPNPRENVTILGFSESKNANRKFTDTHLRMIDAIIADSNKMQKLRKDIKDGRKYTTTITSTFLHTNVNTVYLMSIDYK